AKPAPSTAILAVIFVVQFEPAHDALVFVAALGREIEPGEGAHQPLTAPAIGGVGVKDVPALIAREDAGAVHVLAALDGLRAVIVERPAGVDVLLPKRHAEIISSG